MPVKLQFEKTNVLHYVKTKTLISFAVTAKLISVFVLATWIVQYLYFLQPEFPASSEAIQPCLCHTWSETQNVSFSWRGSNVEYNSFVFYRYLWLSLSFQLAVSSTSYSEWLDMTHEAPETEALQRNDDVTVKESETLNSKGCCKNDGICIMTLSVTANNNIMVVTASTVFNTDHVEQSHTGLGWQQLVMYVTVLTEAWPVRRQVSSLRWDVAGGFWGRPGLQWRNWEAVWRLWHFLWRLWRVQQ